MTASGDLVPIKESFIACHKQLGREDRLQAVNAALDELRASGFLADSVARSGVQGLIAAPPDMPKR